MPHIVHRARAARRGQSKDGNCANSVRTKAMFVRCGKKEKGKVGEVGKGGGGSGVEGMKFGAK